MGEKGIGIIFVFLVLEISFTAQTSGLLPQTVSHFSEIIPSPDYSFYTDNSKTDSLFGLELKDYLKKRKSIVMDEMKRNPQRVAFLHPLPKNVVSQLTPQELENLVEKRGKFVGELQVFYEDDFIDPHKSKILLFLDINGKKYQVFSPFEITSLETRKVTVQGIAFDDIIAADSLKGGIFPSSPEIYPLNSAKIPPTFQSLGLRQMADNLGEQKTLVLLVDVGNEKLGLDKETASRLLFSQEKDTVNDFYIKNSYGKVFFTGDTFGPYLFQEDSCGFLESESFRAFESDPLRAQKNYQITIGLLLCTLVQQSRAGV